MGQVSAKLRHTTDGYAFWCAGCGETHHVRVGVADRPCWTFDGNVDGPTFLPSIHLKVNTPDMGQYYQPDIASTICHYFIRDGKIQFLGDCTHALRGQPVDLPEIPPGHYLTSKPLT